LAQMTQIAGERRRSAAFAAARCPGGSASPASSVFRVIVYA
jgi:hypothetical protein